VAKLKNANFGRRSLAIRDNELAAETLGIATYHHKLTAFVIGSLFAAIAGCLYVFYTSYVEPGMFGWLKSAEWIIMVFFGGRGSITGTVLSSLVLLSLPELLRFADEWRTIIYCITVIIILSYRPNGVLGDKEFSVKGIINWFRKRLNASKAKAAEAKAGKEDDTDAAG
jgi:branched-chain amino acid transport system permease protein